MHWINSITSENIFLKHTHPFYWDYANIYFYKSLSSTNATPFILTHTNPASFIKLKNCPSKTQCTIKWGFPLPLFLLISPNLQFLVVLVALTEEILHGKNHFLCSDICQSISITTFNQAGIHYAPNSWLNHHNFHQSN